MKNFVVQDSVLTQEELDFIAKMDAAESVDDMYYYLPVEGIKTTPGSIHQFEVPFLTRP